MLDNRQVKRNIFTDSSLWFLSLSNIVTIFFAIKENWDLPTVLLIYWFQSVTIGFFNFVRILQLKEFSTVNFKINGFPVEATPKIKVFTAFFFLFHYGFFHFIYLIFLVGIFLAKAFKFGLDSLGLEYIFLTVLLFFANHLFSYFYNRPKDTKKQRIGSLMLYPYARIIPMHLIVILGLSLRPSFLSLLPFFLLLKTVADIIMHVLEHAVIYKGQEDAVQDIDSSQLKIPNKLLNWAKVLILAVLAVLMFSYAFPSLIKDWFSLNLTVTKNQLLDKSNSDVTASWALYSYPSTESEILPNVNFRFPAVFGVKPTLIFSRRTNRADNISEDWGGLIEFKPTGLISDSLTLEFFIKENNEPSFEKYVNKLAEKEGWDSPKYFLAGNHRAARLRYISPDHYDADVGWYFLELADNNIMEISIGGDKKYLYDDDAAGYTTRDKIISTLTIN